MRPWVRFTVWLTILATRAWAMDPTSQSSERGGTDPSTADWIARAQAHIQQGRLAEAEADLAAASSGAAPDDAWIVSLALGRLRTRQGQFTEANALIQQAHSMAEASGDRRREAQALLAQGALWTRQGRYDVAEQALDEALPLLDAERDLEGLAEAHTWLGELGIRQMRFGIAADELELAAAQYDQLGSSYGRAWVLLELGKLRRRQEKSDAAVALYKQSMALSREIGANGLLADAALAYGEERNAENYYNESDPLLHQALALYETMGDLAGVANTTRTLGNMYGPLGRLDDARAMLERSVNLSDQIEDYSGAAWGRFTFGRMLRRQGRLDEAADQYEQSLRVQAGMKDLRLLHNTLEDLSVLRHGQGRLSEAWERGLEALAASDRMVSDFGDEGTLRVWDQNYIDCLADFAELAVELDHPDVALEVALHVKNMGFLWYRALARKVAELSPEARTSLQPTLAARDAAIEGLGTAYAEALRAAPGSPDATVELRDARQRVDDVDRDIARQTGLSPPDFARAHVPEIQAALAADPRHPVLAVYYTEYYYYPYRELLRVWALDGHQIRTFVVATSPESSPGAPTWLGISDLNISLTGTLQRAGEARDEGALAAALQSFPVGKAARLYDILIRPWEDMLACDPGPCRPLLIEPDGVLYYVPFQALLRTTSPGQDLSLDPMQSIRSASFLGRRTAVTILQSSGQLLERFQVPPLEGGALVLGSPAGARLGSAEAREVSMAWRRLGAACRGSVPCPRGPLRDEQASSDALHAWLPRVSVAYLSAHGLYESGRSLLLLADALTSSPDNHSPWTARGKGIGLIKGVSEDGLASKGGLDALNCPAGAPDNCIFSEEILENFLRTELVVLSACDSAQGDPSRAEGQVGLTRSLMMAGADSVLSALWPVATEQTRDWMDAFTRARFKRGLSTADAVLVARRALHGDVELGGQRVPLEHPYFWAGFTLYGYDVASTTSRPARR